ncbi:hypothetical protein FE782_29945 [Paenibacillus antri]|uniref:Lipoprotein LpqB beta-propeller domain-containing protein n=1 Tax=Paenibacillus antri TaxID=2582848 RepID=A0A5R9FX14_9BACL|nr:hypothetical protein [Paenibacillus antri]TLS48537.1 hypothetical protein FE782_29945 [Paenibacillus antri]
MKLQRTGALFLATAALWLTLQGCERNEGGPPDGAASEERSPFPAPSEINSIRVANEADGALIAAIDNAFIAGRLAEGLREAKPSYIDDPEPFGRTYRVDLNGKDKAGQPFTYTFTLNDMTETDALRDAGKVYITGEDGTTKAWTVPSGWIRALFGYDAAADPLLYITTVDASASVVVQANRRIRTASATAAVADTLQVAGLKPGAKAPGYRIHWSDPQRFVVRFDALPEGVSVRFRLDGLASADGETFAVAEQPERNAAVLSGADAWSGVGWAGADGRIERTREVGEAVMLGPIGGDAGDFVAAYGADGTVTLIELETGAARILPDIAWPEPGTPFGNDYGSAVMFSDRLHGSILYAVHGNRTLYRVEIDTGEAAKLYESDRPVKSIATSPDGRRVALLVNLEDSLTAEGDLYVLNEAGERVTIVQKATFGGHSDGFLFPIPIRWVDDRTVSVGRYDADRGATARIDAEDGSIRIVPGAALPERAQRLLDEQVGWPTEAFRVLPHPDGARYAVQTAEGSWLVDEASARAIWLGPGTTLQWADDDRIAVWEQPASSNVRPYPLG